MPQCPNSRTRAVRVIMSVPRSYTTEVPVSDAASPHAVADDTHEGHDAHAGATLGPIDWPAWVMAALGGALGLVVAAALLLAAAA